MKYFGTKNALAKYIWKVLKSRSNEIRIKAKIPCKCFEIVIFGCSLVRGSSYIADG